MVLLVGQVPLSAAGRERGVVESVCFRCRRVIGRHKVGRADRAGLVRTLGLCGACAGELARTGKGEAGAELRRKGRK